ncbi:MAG TPA: IscS subfamily cysteine desulfurase [Psychrobacter sp.]|uniref:Cysteine desulfurase IscS n=1 Tax=Psychrobacter pasteurii TaxID=1945520 RepID=A0A1R4EHC9_9GAMM|nr:IscS subfamily cysteine desulfurase [Psychrobacter pasteurii]SJM37902.1 Cysteine desulfurase [Psychrobacter pasteurii]HAO59638.1 IscS subfamily cysteine desulfurase [Psychrobacter sp.]HJH09928.1 IscS subfamily cysteine desulfurase [Psychrobacter pasteurii]
MSNLNRPIYLDYAATTPVDAKVAKKMAEYMTFEGVFGNPASRSHGYGWQAEEAVETARQQVADLVNADPREIVFTSGATESDNLAIKGAAHFYQGRGKHIITSKIEHKAVLDTCRQLEQEGFEITYIDPQPGTGLILPEQVKEALREDTILVSLMMVNNELGTVTDVKAIGEITREAGVIFHVDGAQAAGKVKIDLEELKIDLMSFSGHKVYGPKGIGALFVRRKPRVRLRAEQHGGGHERGMRSGTLATHQIVGMGEAFAIAAERLEEDRAHTQKMHDKLWQGVQDIEEIYLNGDVENSVPNIINISFNFVEGESLMMSLKDMAVSSGSACTSATLEPSYVLRAIGRPDELAHSSIRFSFGRYTTEEDIDTILAQIHEAVEKLRDLSPLWDMYKDGVDLDSVEWAEH